MFNEMEVPKSLLLILAVVLVRALSNCRIGVDVSRAQIEQAVEKARSRINNNMMFWVGDGTKLRAFKYSWSGDSSYSLALASLQGQFLPRMQTSVKT